MPDNRRFVATIPTTFDPILIVWFDRLGLRKREELAALVRHRQDCGYAADTLEVIADWTEEHGGRRVWAGMFYFRTLLTQDLPQRERAAYRKALMEGTIAY